MPRVSVATGYTNKTDSFTDTRDQNSVLDNDVKINLVKELCANVPDLIMYREATAGYNNQDNVSNIMKFNGVLMFADVSGFTALTERYTLKGDAGVDRLTSTLNKYMGSIVQCILESGGDVLKFAGDAFLALWKVPKREGLKEAITVACRAALTIQDKCDRYMTDIGVELRVKLAISAGNIFVNIGKMSKYPLKTVPCVTCNTIAIREVGDLTNMTKLHVWNF